MPKSKESLASEYGPTIFILRGIPKTWAFISKLLGQSQSSCKRHHRNYLKTLDKKPEIKEAIAAAQNKLPQLVFDAVRQIENVLAGDYTESEDKNKNVTLAQPQMQRIAADLSLHVLKSGDIKVLTDPNKVVDLNIANMDDEQLLGRISKLFSGS